MEYKIDHIIARVLSGESSSDDILKLSDWLNADHKNKDEFRKLKSYWDAEVSFRNSVAPEITLKKLRDKIDFVEKKRKQKKFITIILPKNIRITDSILDKISKSGTYLIQISAPPSSAARYASFSTLNLLISKSSFAKAFITRLPLTFSCTKVFKLEKHILTL